MKKCLVAALTLVSLVSSALALPMLREGVQLLEGVLVTDGVRPLLLLEAGGRGETPVALEAAGSEVGKRLSTLAIPRRPKGDRYADAQRVTLHGDLRLLAEEESGPRRPVFTVDLVVVPAGAPSAGIRAQVLHVEPVPQLDMPIVKVLAVALDNTPQGLGRFVARVSPATKIQRAPMGGPPRPAGVGALKKGAICAIEFTGEVWETSPPQVDATVITILTLFDLEATDTAPSAPRLPIFPPPHQRIEGKVARVHPDPGGPGGSLPHLNSGMLTLVGDPKHLLGKTRLDVHCDRRTRIFVQGDQEISLRQVRPGAYARVLLRRATAIAPRADAVFVRANP